MRVQAIDRMLALAPVVAACTCNNAKPARADWNAVLAYLLAAALA